jgi:DNA helicase-2/ATP-dependent DNA helicase PcrA
MEFDTPSRFIKDFDPRLLRVEGGKADIVGKQSSSFGSSGSFGGPARSGISGYSGGMRRNVQNPCPVATQFVADAKPRLVPIRHEAPRPQSAIGNIGLQEGNVIEHQRFGIGTVIKVEGSGENTKATVEFKNAGIKQLLLKFAKYTIVK